MNARQRGSIKRRGNAWHIALYVGSDTDGKREYRYATAKGSRRETQRELTKMLGQLDTGTFPSPTRETLDAYLDRWLEAKGPSLSPRTLADYRYLLATHVRPLLGSRRLGDLRPGHVQKVYDGMTGRRLSGRTVHVRPRCSRSVFRSPPSLVHQRRGSR